MTVHTIHSRASIPPSKKYGCRFNTLPVEGSYAHQPERRSTLDRVCIATALLVATYFFAQIMRAL